MNTAKQLIKIHVYEQQPTKVLDKWCEEQQNDFAEIIDGVDSLISTAITAADSQMQYDQLRDSRKQFINNLLVMAEKYRCVNTK